MPDWNHRWFCYQLCIQSRAAALVVVDERHTGLCLFEHVNESMADQSNNAQHINKAIITLSDEMHETQDALYETFSAIDQLNHAANNLQEQVSQFNVG